MANWGLMVASKTRIQFALENLCAGLQISCLEILWVVGAIFWPTGVVHSASWGHLPISVALHYRQHWKTIGNISSFPSVYIPCFNCKLIIKACLQRVLRGVGFDPTVLRLPSIRNVDCVQDAYAGVQIPKYVDEVTPEYKPKFDALEEASSSCMFHESGLSFDNWSIVVKLKEAKEAEQKAKEESQRLEKEIAKIQELKKKITTMTADEYFAEYPELKAKFDEEIRNDNWGY
eukprot:Gb_18205 [translate_table: standard]